MRTRLLISIIIRKRKRPLDTPKENDREKIEREGERERQKERYREVGRDKRETEGEREIYIRDKRVKGSRIEHSRTGKSFFLGAKRKGE